MVPTQKPQVRTKVQMLRQTGHSGELVHGGHERSQLEQENHLAGAVPVYVARPPVLKVNGIAMTETGIDPEVEDISERRLGRDVSQQMNLGVHEHVVEGDHGLREQV